MFNLEKTIKKTIVRFTRAEQIINSQFNDWLEDKYEELLETENKNQFFKIMQILEKEVESRKRSHELYITSIKIQKTLLKKLQENKKDK